MGGHGGCAGLGKDPWNFLARIQESQFTIFPNIKKKKKHQSEEADLSGGAPILVVFQSRGGGEAVHSEG